MVNEYPIVAFIGDRGGGKSVSLTAVGALYKSLGMTIFANYELFGIEYQHIDFEDIVDFPEYLHHGVILLDEAHIGADAYAAFQSRVKDITKFATQTRKKGLILIYATQSFTQVAKRLRDLTNYIVYCSTTEYKDIFELRIHDREVENQGFIKSIYLNGAPFYKHYNTNEIFELK